MSAGHLHWRLRSGRALASALCLVAACLGGVVAFAPTVLAAPGGISTFAGGGVGDGGPASAAFLGRPVGVGTDGAGNVYIADAVTQTVRKVATSGIITTVAGNGIGAFAGDGGPATKASLVTPSDVKVDPAGRLVISDLRTNRIRRVDLNGVITTIAGNGTTDTGPEGALATAAGIFAPTALAIDTAGNVVEAEAFLVRRIDSTGHIRTIAGGGSPADGVGDGGLATAAAVNPAGIGFAPNGDLYISDQGNQRIRKVAAATGIITTVAGDGNYNESGDGGPAVDAEIANPVGLAVDSHANIYFAADPGIVRRIDAAGTISTFAGNPAIFGDGGDGGPATAAGLSSPSAVTIGSGGNVLISQAASGLHSKVRRVDVSTGIITTIAGGGRGDGGPAATAHLGAPVGVRVAGGNTYIVDQTDQVVRRVDAGGIISTVAGGGSPADGLGDGLPATQAAFSSPLGLAATADGSLYVADCRNNRVRKVDPGGVMTTVAGGGSPADSVGDGGPALSAEIDCPTGILVVPAGRSIPAGTMFVTDCAVHGGPATQRVRRIDPSGTISTVAGTGVDGFNGDGQAGVATQLSCPSDVSLDPAGNVVIADQGNSRVRRVDQETNIVSTIAGNGATGYGADGGQATATPVNNPAGIAFDAAGNLVIAETSHARIRRVNTAGIISTVAGTGVPGFAGDGGPAVQAQLYTPTQVALDAAGDILVSDFNNSRIRKIDAGMAPSPGPGECGAVVTQSLTLQHDVGPCPAGSDGIVVGADNITVNVNGHTVAGPGPGMGTGSNVGIRLTQRKGVTVTGGTVTGFDSGVALIGSSSSTVSQLSVRRNVAPLITPNGYLGSEFGDGIVLMFSAGNHIDNNRIDANGVFDGIGLLGLGTNDNQITNNAVTNVVGDGRQGTPGIGIGIDISPFLDLTLPGRGNSLHGNNVIGNSVHDNFTNGISVQSNIGATIARNQVFKNGLLNPFPGNGIGIQHNARAEANLHDVIDSNQVHDNGGDGINLIGDQNRITNNNAFNNAQRNTSAFELHELDFDPTTFEPSCLSNVWQNNRAGKAGVNPPCVAGGGGAHGTAAEAARPAAQKSPAPDTSATTDPGSPRRLGQTDAELARTTAGAS